MRREKKIPNRLGEVCFDSRKTCENIKNSVMITKLHNIVGHTSQTRHNLVGNFSKLNRVCVECARWSTCHRIWVDDTAAAALLWKKICVTLYRWEGKVGRARNLSCEKAEKWKIHIFSFIVGYTQTFFSFSFRLLRLCAALTPACLALLRNAPPSTSTSTHWDICFLLIIASQSFFVVLFSMPATWRKNTKCERRVDVNEWDGSEKLFFW